MADERILYRTRPAMLRGQPFRIAGLIFLGWLLVLFLGSGKLGESGPQAAIFLVILLVWVVLLARAALWIARCFTTWLTITDKRTTLRHGLLSKHTTEVRHADVRTVEVNQSLLQRLLLTGDISLGSAGHSGMEIVAPAISSPGKVARLIRDFQE